jgi:hypothetical protein
MKFTKNIIVERKLANEINRLLAERDESFGEDFAITKTAVFDNGFEMDIKCCGCCDDVAWTEAVLFHNGSEVCCTEPCDEFFGEWECTNGDDTFITHVIPDFDYSKK